MAEVGNIFNVFSYDVVSFDRNKVTVHILNICLSKLVASKIDNKN